MNFEQIIFDARSLITVISFLTFIGIIWWTYGAHRGADFDGAAQLPFADDNDTAASEKQHG
ncbi:cbb3-type cytochrome oxidase subunit 3 [Noviherbaspirillum malthae]|uniref:cbb3-type cytochrome oxidase subunit 3 n=1 Tax=Noviherbaspirillum malthae TaxID=1260987 RepID=UPI0018904CF9|nr:CcoQ/FixQ family Cbb3-type cytochrome c oxidase assembly chaperone [Noviherbaspirillum malthae]